MVNLQIQVSAPCSSRAGAPSSLWQARLRMDTTRLPPKSPLTAEIVRLMVSHCGSCHHVGGLGFFLMTYDQEAGRGPKLSAKRSCSAACPRGVP